MVYALPVKCGTVRISLKDNNFYCALFRKMYNNDDNDGILKPTYFTKTFPQNVSRYVITFKI
jgi:hypothetical protein